MSKSRKIFRRICLAKPGLHRVESFQPVRLPAIHLGAYALAKTVEEFARTETIEIGIEAPLKADDWEIVVKDVLEAAYWRKNKRIFQVYF